MVDALRKAAAVLRPGGCVVDLRPAVSYASRLALRRGTRRIPLGPMMRRGDPDIAAADRARREVVRDRSFALVAHTRHRWTSRYASIADLDRMLAANTNWAIPRPVRRRLGTAWREGDVIEVGRVLSLAILRPRVPVRDGRRTGIR